MRGNKSDVMHNQILFRGYTSGEFYTYEPDEY